MSKQKKIIWALDPIEKSTVIQKNIISFLKQWSKKESLVIEPVYIAEKVTKDPDAVQREMSVELKKMKIHGLVEPRIILSNGNSKSFAIKALDLYLAGISADLLVIGAYGKKKCDPFFLGGFAEALLQRSKSSILMIGAEIDKPDKVRTVLYPTNFENNDQSPFTQAVDLAKSFGAKIDVLHGYQPYLSPAYYESTWSVDVDSEINKVSREFVRGIGKQKVQMAKDWLDNFKLDDVEIKIAVTTAMHGVPKAISDFCGKHNVELIVVNGAGSILRRVVRDASCPVLVLRKAG